MHYKKKMKYPQKSKKQEIKQNEKEKRREKRKIIPLSMISYEATKDRVFISEQKM